MFTGIVQAIGKIQACQKQDGDVRLQLACGNLPLDGVVEGDSIAVNGVCLTVQQLCEDGFIADVSRETLSLTTLGELSSGSPVNLEKSLTLQTPMGGHWVSGHVDGLAEVLQREEDARSVRFSLRVPKVLARYIAQKGSVTLDGTSLTVNTVEDDVFTVNIVPHTLQKTIMSFYTVGNKANLEVDILARYLERLLQTSVPGKPTIV